MSTYCISHNYDEAIGMVHEGLDAESTMNFLLEVDAYLYSVSEWDENDDIIGRLNGEEWLNQNTEMVRALKAPIGVKDSDGNVCDADTGEIIMDAWGTK